MANLGDLVVTINMEQFEKLRTLVCDMREERMRMEVLVNRFETLINRKYTHRA